MAGYSGTPLPRKLGIRPGLLVFVDDPGPDAPHPDLGGLGDPGEPEGPQVVYRLPRSADLTISFHTARATLTRRLPTLFERTSPAGAVWVCWPKKAAQRTLGIASDLDDDTVRTLGLELGFVDVKVAAIDEVWSGLKFVRRLEDR